MYTIPAASGTGKSFITMNIVQFWCDILFLSRFDPHIFVHHKCYIMKLMFDGFRGELFSGKRKQNENIKNQPDLF